MEKKVLETNAWSRSLGWDTYLVCRGRIEAFSSGELLVRSSGRDGWWWGIQWWRRSCLVSRERGWHKQLDAATVVGGEEHGVPLGESTGVGRGTLHPPSS